jgi:hypothetical protein
LIDVIRECRKIVGRTRTLVEGARSGNQNDETVREEVRGVVDGYFLTDRTLLLEEFGQESIFDRIDALMRDLLLCTQTRTSKSHYCDCLLVLEQAWSHVEVQCMPLARELVGDSTTDKQYAVLTRLKETCPPSAVCFKQALRDLNDSGRRSWRGTATELREALRELLDMLAPSQLLMNSSGFRLEDGQKAPTMKQKTRFILKARDTPESRRRVVEDAMEVVEEKVGSFLRSVYTRSSVSVHTDRGRKEVVSILRFVEAMFIELLEIGNE